MDWLLNKLHKLGIFLVSAGVFMIFALLFLRDKIYGEPDTDIKFNSIVLCLLGFLFTFPISVPCIILGTILWQFNSLV